MRRWLTLAVGPCLLAVGPLVASAHDVHVEGDHVHWVPAAVGIGVIFGTSALVMWLKRRSEPEGDE